MEPRVSISVRLVSQKPILTVVAGESREERLPSGIQGRTAVLMHLRADRSSSDGHREETQSGQSVAEQIEK